MPRSLPRSLMVLLALGLAASGCDPDGQLPLPGADASTSANPTADADAAALADAGADSTTTTSTTAETDDATGGGDSTELDATLIDLDDADTSNPDPEPEPTPGSLCASCDGHESCGGQNDLCLENNDTGEVFCGQHCQSAGECPGGYTCVDVGGIGQCVPESETCGNVPEPEPACEPACPSGEICVEGSCVEGGMYEAELQHCVDVINQHRAATGRSALTRDAQIESCATDAAIADSQTGQAHGYFQETQGCGGIARAENEIPGWNLANYGSLENVIEVGAQMMMDEGPGGGHHDNIVNSGWTRVGCGIHVTSSGAVWVVHNFR